MTTPQAAVIPGDYTIAGITASLPPASYRRCLAWATDIQPSGGFMVSTGSAWINAVPNTILNGSGSPSSGTGNNGDFYINDSATSIYGPKAVGVWGSAISLIGSAGIAATIAVGTVTALAAGATPTVVNAGSSSAATFNFGIPTSAALSTTTPQPVGTAAVGTGATAARDDHVHAPKTLVSLASVTTATDGTYTWTYPTAYGAGVVPNIQCCVQATSGTTDVLNVQVDGVPTNTQAKFRVTRTAQTVVSLLGLTILSVPATIGAQNLFLRAEA